MKVEADVLGSPSLTVRPVAVGCKATLHELEQLRTLSLPVSPVRTLNVVEYC